MKKITVLTAMLMLLGLTGCDHIAAKDNMPDRVFKDKATESQIENLKYKLYEGKATRADITRITKQTVFPIITLRTLTVKLLPLIPKY